MLNKSFQLSLTSIDTQKKCSPAIGTWQVAGLDITLATPRKVSFDYHRECRNIHWSKNDRPSPPVCSLQSKFCTHRLEWHLIIGYSFGCLLGNNDQYCGLFLRKT